MKKIYRLIKKLLGIIPPPEKRIKYIDFIQPDAIMDIGANIGMSAESYLNIAKFKEPIYSFEPVSHLYKALEANARTFENWYPIKKGIGDFNEKQIIHVSGGHGGASSILTMTDELEKIAPDMKVFKEEEIEIVTLTDFYIQNNLEFKKIFLKIDVQGYESNVLKGAEPILDKVAGMKIELSIIKQYKEEKDIFELLPYLLNKGFSVYTIEEGWRNPQTNELLQVDIILFNKNLV